MKREAEEKLKEALLDAVREEVDLIERETGDVPVSVPASLIAATDAMVAEVKAADRRRRSLRRTVVAALVSLAACAVVILFVLPFADSDHETDFVTGLQAEILYPGGPYGFPDEIEIDPDRLERFEKAVRKRSAYFYSDPAEYTEEELDAIAERIGFSPDQRIESRISRWSNVYENPETGEKLSIDRYGRYAYDIKTDEPFGVYSLTDEESANAARTFLEDHHIPTDAFPEWEVSATEWNTTFTENGSIEEKTAVTIHFAADDQDGFPVRGGGISVHLKGNGNVSRVSSYALTYQSKQRTELVSVSEAIERIRRGEAMIGYEGDHFDSALRIVIEGLSCVYSDGTAANGEYVIQPFYVFFGTAYNQKGEETSFTAAVQANRY